MSLMIFDHFTARKILMYVALDSLNAQLKIFKYEGRDKGNEKSEITLAELENNKFKTIAKQMM